MTAQELMDRPFAMEPSEKTRHLGKVMPKGKFLTWSKRVSKFEKKDGQYKEKWT